MLRQIVLMFFSWKAIILVFVILASHILPLNRGFLGYVYFPDVKFTQWVWANFDGNHYLDIGQSGYRQFTTPFFPLLPLLIFILHKILTLTSLQAGLLISNLSLFLALFFVYKIVLLDYSKKQALLTCLFVLLFPMSFFYGAIYTESLFFLNATLSFYFARKSNWLLAGIFGLLAGFTRLMGIALLPALLFEWYHQNKNNKKKVAQFIKTRAFYILLSGLGVIIYSLYLQFRFGDFSIFFKAMELWKQNEFTFPLQTIWRYLNFFFLFPKANLAYWVAVLEFVSTIFYFALSLYVLIKIRISYGVFMLISLIIPIFTGTLQSMPRYILHLFPAFLALVLITGKNRLIFAGVIIIFLILGFLFTALFTRGYFIA